MGTMIILTILFIPIMFFLFMTVYSIPAGHVGVYDLFGNVNDKEIPTGLHMKNPLASVTKMSVMTKEYTMSIISDEGAKQGSDTISALTKEGLSVDLDVTVWYKIIPDKASDIYQNVGTDYVNIIVRPKVREAIRSVIARYEAKNIYSEDREKVQVEIQQEIEKDLSERGIIIEKVLLRNVGLPVRVSNAIEQKLEAEQQSQQMQFVLERERQEAERKIIEADGIAKSQDIIDKTLTQEYLTYLWIQNLDKHNSVMYVPIGSSGLPFFKDIDNVNKNN
jgi:regulator of protease activity HflC (stomatin/prohibitin superfamily)